MIGGVYLWGAALAFPSSVLLEGWNRRLDPARRWGQSAATVWIFTMLWFVAWPAIATYLWLRYIRPALRGEREG